MSEFDEKYFALIDSAQEENYAPQTAYKLNEAIQLASEDGRKDYELLARYLYTFSIAPIDPEKSLVSFAWCLAHIQHCGPMIPKASIIELYSIVTGILRSYPSYSLEQIESTFLHMEEEYRELGLPIRDVLHCRLYGKLGIGDREGATEIYKKWKISEPGPRTCSVCDRSTSVLYHVYLDQPRRALNDAQPILSGDMVCGDGQPMITQCASLIPLVRESRFDEAERHFRESVRQLGNIGFAGIWSAGRQLFYLSLIGDFKRGRENIDRFLPIANSQGTPTDRFGYWLASRSFVAAHIEQDQPLSELDGFQSRDPEKVLEVLDEKIFDLSHKFDERNKNGEYTRIANAYIQLFESLKAPFP